MKRLIVLAFLALLLCTAASAKSDTLDILRTITVQGTVRDVSGNPISDAQIQIVNLGGTPAVSDSSGFYRMYRGINSGLIILRVSKPGYLSVIKANIIVHADGPRIFNVDCVLESTP